LEHAYDHRSANLSQSIYELGYLPFSLGVWTNNGLTDSQTDRHD